MIYLRQLKPISLIVSFAVILSASNAFAFDKRVPLFISPPQKMMMKMIAIDSRQEVEQYNPMNQRSIGENNMRALRTQLRYSPTDKIETAFEWLYFQNRTQEVTNSMGVKTKILDSSGIGDSCFHLTYLFADARQEKFGLLFGGELKFPTGDQEEGRSTGSYDTTLRTTLSVKTKIGFPYFAVLYTWTGEGEVNGIETDEADELFLNLGLKSRRWHGLSFNTRLYFKQHYGNAVRVVNNAIMVSDEHKTTGAFLEMNYALNKRLELGVLLEKVWAEDSRFTTNGIPVTTKNNVKNRLGLTLRVLW